MTKPSKSKITSIDSNSGKSDVRRQYSSPVLSLYGSMDALTQGGDPNGTNDPGGPSTGKL